MYWYWELGVACITIILLLTIDIGSTYERIGTEINWLKKHLNVFLSATLFILSAIAFPTFLLVRIYCSRGTDFLEVLKLLQFYSWNDVFYIVDGSFLAIYSVFIIPLLFYKEKGLMKSIQIALLCVPIAYLIPIATEHYWFTVHEIVGFREFSDLYINGTPEWFSHRILSSAVMSLAFLIFRAHLPEDERLFFYRRKEADV